MRKKLCWLSVLMLVLALPLSAASEVEMLQFISRAGISKSEFSTPFKETRAFPRKEKVTLTGTLQYRSPDFLDMVYEHPDQEHFLIDGTKMINRREGREVKSDLTRNQLMRRLANTLLYAFSGQVEKISTEQNTTLKVSEVKNEYHVILDACKKQAMGYCHIEIHYRKSDGQIVFMQMDEFNGTSTIYALAE
ncbi:MAG: hypothetical protein J6Y06_03080 [Bacteroidales bacterium]|nr:hypothetical protein [Bacteroidales bacterium]